MREGSRDYFYNKLDDHFPGMKEKYVKTFGNSYECRSPGNSRLSSLYRDVCRENGIIYKPDDVFGFLRKYESDAGQMKMF